MTDTDVCVYRRFFGDHSCSYHPVLALSLMTRFRIAIEALLVKQAWSPGEWDDLMHIEVTSEQLLELEELGTDAS